jgi:hypothetical protein
MVSGMRGLMKQIRGDQYQKKPSYPNVTKLFFDFLLHQNHNQAQGSILIIAQKRWGKTLVAGAIFENMMRNEERQLWLIDCPQLVEILDKQFKGRVFNTDDLSQIPNNSIIYFDETLVSLGGKRALTKYSRKFGEALSFTSHKQIYVVGCGQTDGMIKDLRDKAEIVILGRLPLFFLESCKEAFIKDLKDELLMLPKDQAYIFANSFDFSAKGKLIGDKRDWCPWFSDEFSMNMSEISLDTDKEKKIKELYKLNEVVELIKENYNYQPAEMTKTKFLKTIKGDFLLNDLSLYVYLDEKNLWSNLESMLLSNARTEKKNKTENEDLTHNNDLEISFSENQDFPEFLKENLKDIDKNLSEMAYFWASGLSYRQIYSCLPNITPFEINNKLKQFKESGVNGNNDLRSGFLFEKWFAKCMMEQQEKSEDKLMNLIILLKTIISFL